jgi:hypothetical protein
MACLLTQTRLDGGLDIAAGLPGRPDAPAPVSNTVQPLRSPHSGAAQAADTAARSPRLTGGYRTRRERLLVTVCNLTPAAD